MKTFDVAIIGAGPGGLCAALAAAQCGVEVALVERDRHLGGQLVKQTHMFFGSEKQQAGVRGMDIGASLIKQVQALQNVTIFSSAMALGYYDDKVLLIEQDNTLLKIKTQHLIVATGAAERMLVFPNNDLPGVFGAGAVQTLMNVEGVKPGERVLMVGAGNIGLIVSYQLLQAGVHVEAILDGAPEIGGYLVHASKVRRMGVPILTSHTIIEACGQEHVTGAVIGRLDEEWNVISGSERTLDVDTICLAVGLTPLTELLWQAGCKTQYVPYLGGHVIRRDANLQTSVLGIYVAGDVASVEEASSAMVEGQLAGAAVAKALGRNIHKAELIIEEAHKELQILRRGPMGEKTRIGLAMLEGGKL